MGFLPPIRRLFFFMTLLLTSLHAFGAVKFTETRYLAATGKSIKLKGEIEFQKDGVTVFYSQPAKKTLSVKGDTLSITNEDGTKEILKLNENRQLSFYFSIFKAINEKNLESFKDYFDVQKNGQISTLLPKNELKKAISLIKVTSVKETPSNIKIELTNGDKIEINAEN